MIYIAKRGSFPVEAEYWVRDELMFKQSLANQAGDGRRILILSGSSGLFGVDPALIEHLTGLKTINLSTHAGLPLNFQLDYADKIVRAGDLIILPLEYEYYPQPPAETSTWWDQMALAAFPAVFRELTMIDRLKALLRMKPQILWDGAYVSARRLVQPSFMAQRDLAGLEVILSKWRDAPHSGATQYGVEGTNERGDIERNCESRNARWRYPIATSSYSINPEVIEILKHYAAGWKERGVRAYVSFPPVSIDVLAAPHFHENTEKLIRLLDAAGVVTIGKPNDFVFSRKAFFDTPYHLNCNSRIERTLILLRQLTISARSANTDSKRTSGVTTMAGFLRISA